MSEAARIDLIDRAPLTEKQQNVYESIMQYQRVNGYADSICVINRQRLFTAFLIRNFLNSPVMQVQFTE